MKKRLAALVLVIVFVLALAGCGGREAVAEEKNLTLTVIHSDKSETRTGVVSKKETLGEALTDAGIIAGEEGAYGLYVKTVDGETADESREQWWCLTKGGQSVNTGVDSTPFADGDAFEFTLMEGY